MSRMRRSASNGEHLPSLSASTPNISGQKTVPSVLNNSTFKRSGADSTPGRSKYDATRKWNAMITLFCEKIPQDNNRRFFKTYCNTFSGTQASDILTDILPRVFTDRKCERTNAVRVLQKFMDDHIIEEVNGFKEFKDDTTSFYRLTEATRTSQGMEPPPAKVRRSASLNDRDRQQTTPCSSRDFSRPVKLTNFQSKTSQNFSFNSSQIGNLDLRTPKRYQIKTAESEESPPARLERRFAQVVDFNTDDMESRKTFLDVQLMGLLDGIITDSNLSDMERHKKLMEFKNNYPRIFAYRYPDNTYVAPPTPLLHRIKDFLGGN